MNVFFFFSSRRRHTIWTVDWSSDVCSSDLSRPAPPRIDADVSELNFNYDVRRDKHFPWRPAQVFDDGAHVYIKLPETARHSEVPAVFIVAEDGSRTLLNYSV